MIFPTNKLVLVRGLKAGLWTAKQVSDRFAIPLAEVQSWVRAYDIAHAKGWEHIRGQEICA